MITEAKNPILYQLLKSDTALLRFFFGWCNLGWALWVLFDKCYTNDHPLTIRYVGFNSNVILAILFLINGIALIYGFITHRFSVTLFFMEGLLGAYLWVGVGITETVMQGTPGPTIFAGFVALFLCARYPTHNEWSRKHGGCEHGSA